MHKREGVVGGNLDDAEALSPPLELDVKCDVFRRERGQGSIRIRSCIALG